MEPYEPPQEELIHDEILRKLVLQCQMNTEQATYQATLEELWTELSSDLTGMATAWLGSSIASDLHGTAMGMFANIIFALPHIRSWEVHNMRTYLLQIAKNKTIDEYRNIYTSTPYHKRRKKLKQDETPTPGTAAASLAPSPATDTRRSQHSVAGSPNAKIYHMESDIFAEIDEQLRIKRLFNYLSSKIPRLDLHIIYLRAIEGQSFRDISSTVGLTEANTRQRYHRTVIAIRQYLKAFDF